MPNIQQESNGDLTALLKINIEPDDYMPKVKSTLKDYSKQAHMNGFRKGRVPSNLIKKMYGNQILAEEINRLLQESISEHIQKNDLELLGYPIPVEGFKVDLDIYKSSDYIFEYEMGMAPAFDLKYVEKSPKYVWNKVDITEEMITEEIEKLQKQYGKSITPESIDDNAILHVDLAELGEDMLVLEEGVTNSTSLSVDQIKNEKYRTKILSAKKGDAMNIPIFELFDKDNEQIAKYMLNLKDDEVTNVGKHFQMTITQVMSMQPAELDEEFFEKVYGKDEEGNLNVADIDQLKAKIAEEIDRFFDRKAQNIMLKSLSDDILEKTKFELPDNFLRRWIRHSNEKPISVEQVDEDYPAFERNLRWSLIVNKIAKDNSFKVEEAEIRDYSRYALLNQLWQYGIVNPEPERLEAMVNNQMQDQGHVSRSRDVLMENKIFDYLKTKIKIKEKSVSKADFEEIEKKSNEQNS